MLSCGHCLKIKKLRALAHAGKVCLGVEDDVLRQAPLHTWRGLWSRWGAVRKAIKRGGAQGFCRVRTQGGQVVAVADVAFRGSSPVSPAEALGLLSDAIAHRLELCQHTIRFSGSWAPEKREPKYLVVAQNTHPETMRVYMTALGAEVHAVGSVSGYDWCFPVATDPELMVRAVLAFKLLATFVSDRKFPKDKMFVDIANPAHLELAREWAEAVKQGRYAPPGFGAEDAAKAQEAFRARSGPRQGGP
jgi:hypothetical protein